MTEVPRSRPVLSALLATALVAACSSSPEAPVSGPSKVESPRPERQNRLIWGTQQEPDSLNPILSDMFATTQISNLCHGFLVRIDDKMNIVPDLIEEVPSLDNGGISEDYLTWTYHLRKNATWHDGAPVTSKDVAFTQRLIMDPEFNASTRDIHDKVASLETPDEHTVVFHLKEVFAPFYLIFNDLPILPEHLLGAKTGKEMNTDPYNRNPVGAGPYKLKAWESGALMEFAAYDGYFRGRPKIDEIAVKFIPEEQVLMVQLQTGEIDYYDSANTTQYDELRKIPGVTVTATPANTWEHLDLQCDKPLLSDKRVRRAIGYAIDKQQISEKVYRGLWKPAYSDQAPLSWAYDPGNESRLVYDSAKAMALLDEAGWKDSDGDGVRDRDGQKLSLQISTPAGKPGRERTEQVIQEQLRKVGIEISIKNYNATLFFGTLEEGGILKTGKYDLGMFAWTSPTDPDNYTIFAADQVPPAGQNSTFWRNEEATELLREGRRTVDREKRKSIYAKVQAILADEMPMVPLLYWVNIDPVTTRLKNFRPNPSRQGNTWNVWEWELEL